jgi:cation:H+ antiporter
MLLNIILLIGGFIVLIKGADFFVDGASSIAGNFKVSKMLIGLTIVAFGTSLPEFAVSVKSIASGNYDIVLGNVIGSNILNILLILGVSSLFHNLNVKNSTVKKELPIIILMTLAFGILISDSLFDCNTVNNLTRGDGIIILLFFLVFIYYLFSMMQNKVNENDETEYLSLKKSILFTVLGAVAIVVGSNFVVDSAAMIATSLGVSQKLISLTIIALGTSIPELVTSVTATRKGEYDIAIGNVIGSNIFNIGIVIGLPVAIFGGISKINFNYIDIFVMLLAVLLLFIFSLKDRKISKYEGMVFLIIFVVYYSYVIVMG